jgi:hypothetical protein
LLRKEWKELHRVRDSKTSDSSADDVYKPTLWYFDLLLVTADQENPRKSKSNLDEAEMLMVMAIQKKKQL